MNVNRSVVLNPIEPSPLSFRAPVGMLTHLNVNFFGQDGGPYGSDVGGQLQLTGRTSAATATYFMVATDVANGRARATIPAGELTDPNGYRLRLVGTVNSEPLLLAMGTVVPTAAAGLEDIPVDTIDQVPLRLDRSTDCTLALALWQDAGKTSPYDLTATAITATVTASHGGTALVPFTVTLPGGNDVQLSLTAAQIAPLPDSCWWSLAASTSAGSTTLAEGPVTVSG